jgi:hypothetical protein
VQLAYPLVPRGHGGGHLRARPSSTSATDPGEPRHADGQVLDPAVPPPTRPSRSAGSSVSARPWSRSP